MHGHLNVKEEKNFLYFRNGLLGNISHMSSDYLTQKRCGNIYCYRQYYSIIVYKEMLICDISLC